jgi:hypothetical protein
MVEEFPPIELFLWDLQDSLKHLALCGGLACARNVITRPVTPRTVALAVT